MDPVPLFEREAFRDVAGQALRPGGTRLTSLALEHCLLAPGAPVADVGCGRGASLKLLAGQGFTPIGLDPSPRLLAEARELEASGPAGALVRGTAEAIPLRSGAFAAVLCECVLTVTRDPRLALAEMRRILAPGGLLLLTDIYLRDPVDALAPRAAGCASGAVSRPEMEDRLRGAGFCVRVFEDHSRLLAELAGRLVFAGLDRAELGIGCSGAGRPGYYLCIATAEDV
ncbi:DVU_1556 family methyltransferase [Fundidesulfovibrio terrae]|uniref:DVU_1556 family methyltransferase n=1 Tax=Fundidesulfovibrio terrae TaxID=2922866 RepID=UPI001FAF45CD|nr:class I SAM-dependent methyltransferase [Fundidesulfovibrio terrae]